MTDPFSPHRDAVVRTLERRFGSRELAEDAVQDALAAALASGEIPENPKAWLHVVAHRRAVDTMRGQREAPHAQPPEVGAACDPSEVLALRERVRSVLGALHSIPRRQRDAVLLRSLEDRSYEEIGARLDVEPENAKQLVSRGRRALRSRIAGLLPAPLFARLAELFQRSFELATGTVAGRACAGLCVAGAFAGLSAEAPVVRQLAAAPVATATPTSTPTPTPKPRVRAKPRRTPTPEPVRTAAPTPVATTAATPEPVRTAVPTPTATPVATPDAQDLKQIQSSHAEYKECARSGERERCEAEFLQRSTAQAAERKAAMQDRVAKRSPKLTPQSSDEDRALWLRRQYASGQCARTPAGIRTCTDRLRAQPRAGKSKAS